MGNNQPTSQPQLGQRLYGIRTQKGLTQLELREKSHVSVRTIQRIESGTVTPRAVTIKILLEALDENPDDWYRAETNKENTFSIKTLGNLLLVNPTDLDLKNALNPAWISGIIYLLMVFFEISLGEFSELSSDTTGLWPTMVIVKVIAAISFLLFTRGILSLSLLFEVQLLKIASYLSMVFVVSLYLSEAGIILFSQSLNGFEDTLRAIAIVPLGAISIFLGVGLIRLQDGMGRIAKVAGNLELSFGICYMTLILSFIGILILVPLLIVEIVLLSKADQQAKNGEL
jgi:transcriptional regulator with XRE-family HTH domain